MSTSAPVAEPGRAAGASPTDVVLLTGISGSGKSVALHALEDAGYFCVDNLPPELLRDFLRLEHERSERRVAIAVERTVSWFAWFAV
ncbi:MAG TPA: RNase adapter RapZ, partial [Rubrivivax sp.]|nr:RNase adapter RapZ [Rubrivivax sp.]